MKLRSYMIIGLLAFIILIAIPLFVWQLKQSEQLHVAILDKTVPDTTYREHNGLMWLLNHFKYTKADGTAYNVQDDYFGYVPGDNHTFTTREFSVLEPYDLIYIADTYGVYTDDLTEEHIHGNRSSKIYGGLSMHDVEQIKTAAYEGSTIIAEFNTFGSPTESDVREQLYDLLGVRWTGWIGRYFDDLSSDGEIPSWAVMNYEHQTGERWRFSGPGFLFASEQDEVLILEQGKHTGKRGSEFVWSEAGEQFVGASLRVKYNYWFDIIEYRANTEVLANYEIDLTPEGERQLYERGIPSHFPAVIRQDVGIYTSYYFAGDYADNEEVSPFYKAAWLDRFHSFFATDSYGSQQRFYWKAYRPLMETIFKEIKARTHEQNEVSTHVLTEDGMSMIAKTNDNYLELYRHGKWEPLLIKGVNIGMGKPGTFPGEAAITKDEYYRWFQHIGDMNANTIRNYTLHPPAFYEALLEYNLHADEPLYLFHGIWINEEVLVASQDAYDAVNRDEFIQEMKHAVDIIHGNKTLPHRPGHASGTYIADISEYVLGWMIGIEWDPELVLSTDTLHAGMADYKGRYFSTEQASPFEVWLATMMDEIAKYEADHYRWQRPMSFTNWVTTDLLDHPSEPFEKEDLVAIDPNNIIVSDDYIAGQFATYHVYPYYPDFLNYQTNYTEYIDHRGEKNSYAGYLNDLRQVHDMPVVIAEFGVPTSRGMTHRNIRQLNQGNNSEIEQGQYNVLMFEDIYMANMAGGIVFTWQDEWFKRSWNTMDFDNPDRRPFWSNIQVSEQFFGLLAFEPGRIEDAMYVDGSAEDWERNGIEPIPLQGNKISNSEASHQGIEHVFVTSDEKAMYFRIDVDSNSQPQPLDWSKTGLLILLDTIPDQGQHNIPGGSGLVSEAGIDFAIDLRGDNESRIWIDSYYDSHYFMYGDKLKMIPHQQYANKKNNGVFHQMNLVLSQELDIPNVHGETLHVPFEQYETGLLEVGNGNPNSASFHSLTDLSYDESTGVIEVRIPWQLLNVKDPSTREIMGDLWKVGLEGSMKATAFRIAVLAYDINTSEELGGSRITCTMPALEHNMIRKDHMYHYQWDTWEQPTYHERLKQSYYIVQELFERSDYSR